MSVAHDVGGAHAPGPGVDLAQWNRGWIEKCLRDGAAVDMQFLMRDAIDADVEHNRRKRRWNRRGSQQDLPDERERLRVSAIGNAPDIPNHLYAGIEIGGDNGERAAAPVFLRDTRHNGF